MMLREAGIIMQKVFIKNGEVHAMVNDSQKSKDDYTAEEKDVQLESLRTQLDKVKREKMELENKEHTIQNLINKLTQGE